MKAVGVRELKDRLSESLRLVKNGEEILVTDRGDVVAEIRKPTPRAALPYPGLLEAVSHGCRSTAASGHPRGSWGFTLLPERAAGD